MRALEFINVSHYFDDTPAIDDISIGVEAGELVCLLGPSGCGKTTLLRLAAGLETLQRGRITIGGTTVAAGGPTPQLPPEKRGVGLMFQDYALFPHLTVTQNIGFGLRNKSRDRGWIERALGEVHLAYLGKRYPHTLSGGQQQRIALLRALAPNPDVLLLDEPFSGLDEHLRQHLRQETRALLTKRGVTTLMVTHDPEEAMFLADRIVVLNHGQMAQDGTPIEIYTAPADPFTVRLFGPTNTFEGVVYDGRIDTVLGSITASGMQDGQAAVCLVRADGIEVSPAPPDGGGHTRARVVSARILGPTSYILLELSTDAAPRHPPTMIEVRRPGIHLPAADSELWIRADQEHIFTFALH